MRAAAPRESRYAIRIRAPRARRKSHGNFKLPLRPSAGMMWLSKLTAGVCAALLVAVDGNHVTPPKPHVRPPNHPFRSPRRAGLVYMYSNTVQPQKCTPPSDAHQHAESHAR